MVSKQMIAYIEKEYKELTDHYQSALKSKDGMQIWYYSGALMELAYLKDFVGYKDKGEQT
jgi:hypothetical protein